MYLERRLWEHTEGVRGRIVLATVIGLLAAGVGVARLALLGWLIAKVFSGAELAELVWPIIAIGAVMILLVPTFVLAMHSPFEIRVLLKSTAAAGRTVGAMNGIATLGAIIGTLGTSFFLIPSFGSRALSIGIGVTVIVAGVVYLGVAWMLHRRVL